MKHFLRFTILSLFLTMTFLAQAQEGLTVTIYGQVTDFLTEQPVEFATIYVESTSSSAQSDINGHYSLTLEAGKPHTLIISRAGYKGGRFVVDAMRAGEKKKLDFELVLEESDIEVIVKESKIETPGMVREDAKKLLRMPNASGNLEAVLPSIGLGVSSGSGGELSSQYNVRGGNYDENLVYVNDFEIYRPQLIRSGQQEGLTFPNIDLVKDIYFSSGGFQPRFGDKMSSVLDIHYKRPDSLRASVGISFLGGSAHIEGTGKKKKFRYLMGARYKTTKYLLSTLDVEGEYLPNFTDVQAHLTYDFNPHWQWAALGNYNKSTYHFTPQTRSTSFGLVNFALKLYSVFEGGEKDDFTTAFGGTSLTYLSNTEHNPYYLKWLVSSYQSDEYERFDIQGQYLLGQVDTQLGSETEGDFVSILGAGTQHTYARNHLQSNVTNFAHKGGLEIQLEDNSQTKRNHFLQWGAKIQREDIADKLNEWERLDSALYSLPYSPDSLFLSSVLKSKNKLVSMRYSAYVQDAYTVQKDSVREIKIVAGVRAGYWDTNKEPFVTPRAQLTYKPLRGKRDISYRFAVGMYYQPPFYREMRNLSGVVNKNVLAQKSMHFVGGFTWDFFAGKKVPKKFRFTTEAYYKRLWDLVSYDQDNVRIRYAGENNAKGYVTGLDLRINGEFVPDAESWINLSFLRAREALDGVEHYKREIGKPDSIFVKYVPRPTDQFMNLSMFFQDYLKNNKNVKMHMNLSIGSGLPFGIKDNNIRYRNPYRYKAYHRVDMGFAFLLWDEGRAAKRPRHPLRFTRSTWLSFEVFNMMKVSNVASYTWIKTIFKRQYAVPNHLSSRRLNVRLRMEF